MNKFFLLLSGAVMTVLLGTACSGAQKGCSIEGKTSFQEYSVAYLEDLDQRKLDSVRIEDGRFAFHVTDSVAEPFALVVKLVNPQDATDFMSMPVMVETGTVALNLGEYVYTSGTPLNQRVQEFLNALQQMKDGVMTQDDMKAADVAAAFSEFYRDQMLQNAGNVLGKYLFLQYGWHLTPADRELVEAQFNPK